MNTFVLIVFSIVAITWTVSTIALVLGIVCLVKRHRKIREKLTQLIVIIEKSIENNVITPEEFKVIKKGIYSLLLNDNLIKPEHLWVNKKNLIVLFVLLGGLLASIPSYAQVDRVENTLNSYSFDQYIDLPEDQKESIKNNFYTSFNPNSPKMSCHLIVRNHTALSYKKAYEVIEIADASPSINMVVDIYGNKYFNQTQSRGWHREHVWPKSLGFVVNNKCNSPYTDCHALFAVYPPYNSSRRNKPFDFCHSADCIAKPVENTSKKFFNLGNKNVWEVWDGRKGDVARACFYMDVRYEGAVNEKNNCPEPDLILTNDMGKIQSSKENESVSFMGKLSTLITWHQMDPPSEQERLRNEVVFYFQHNRNPFIDNPQWVYDIWGN